MTAVSWITRNRIFVLYFRSLAMAVFYTFRTPWFIFTHGELYFNQSVESVCTSRHLFESWQVWISAIT